MKSCVEKKITSTKLLKIRNALFLDMSTPL